MPHQFIWAIKVLINYLKQKLRDAEHEEETDGTKVLKLNLSLTTIVVYFLFYYTSSDTHTQHGDHGKETSVYSFMIRFYEKDEREN